MPPLLLREFGLELPEGVPVQACEQVLVVWPLCKSADALLLCFFVQEMLKLPPWVCHLDLIAEQELVLGAAPVHEVLCIPPPFC